MNFKTTYVLFGVLAVALGAFLLTQMFGGRGPDTGAHILPSAHKKTGELKAKDIQAVEIDVAKPKAQKLTFVRDDKGWRLKEPSVRADGPAVERVINDLLGA